MGLLLIALLSMSVTACSDDDEKTEEEVKKGVEVEDGKIAPDGDLTSQEQLLLAQQEAIISILTNLTGITEVDPRFDQKKYEPTYGSIIDEAQPFVRSLKCDSVETAELNFRGIVSADTLITPTPDGLAISLKDMPLMADGTKLTLGTMVFHRGDGIRLTGWVDVDIPCIPKLQRIEYLVSAAFPENAGSAYLEGDIVWIPRGNYCSGYYLCVSTGNPGLLVHLCKGEAGDDETYNLDGDGCGVWCPYNKKKGQSTDIWSIRSYVTFLAENKDKVYKVKKYLQGEIIDKPPLHPDKIHQVLPGGFATDENYAYKADEGAHIWYDAHYDGYAWIPAYDYRKGYYGWVPNYCNNGNNVQSYYWRYVKDSDWKKWWNEGGTHYTMNVIRFYGKIDNASAEFSPINSRNLVFDNNCKYAKQKHVGWVFGMDGNLYENATKAKKAGTTAIGIVAYVNDGSDFGNKVTEKARGYGHGLVISQYMPLSKNVQWNSGSNAMVTPNESYGYTQFVNMNAGTAAALTDFEGLSKTESLYDEGSPAATYAMDFGADKESPYKVPGGKITSSWFLPSTAQWIAMLCSPGVGGQPMVSKSAAFPTYIENGTSHAYEKLNSLIKGNSWKYYSMDASDDYWSSSAYDDRTGVYVTASGGYGTRLTYNRSKRYAYVRPVFAF